MTLTDILEPISEELIQVEETLRDITQVEYLPLAEVLDYILSRGGKRIRPALVLLATKFHPVEFEHVVALAAAMETLHTATLVHDDMIDRSTLRRGHPTINAFWSDGATVLTGDYIFARAASFAAATANIRVVRLFAEVLKTMVDGELRQLFRPQDGLPAREDYYRRIYSKTASLFALATQASGILTKAPEEEIRALWDYGYHLGMAFQIVDDILDFVGEEHKLGKPIGSDLRQGTITLPVYYFAEAYPDHPTLKRYYTDGADREAVVMALVDAICGSEAIDHALAEARRFVDEAQHALRLLPDILPRQIMSELADYIVERQT